MRKSQFGLNMGSSGLPNSFVLIPETPADRYLLMAGLEEAGVKDSLGFIKDNVNGCLRFPSEPTWTDDGAVCISVELHGSQRIESWFWLVESDDGSGRRFAWWSFKQRDIGSAIPWN